MVADHKKSAAMIMAQKEFDRQEMLAIKHEQELLRKGNLNENLEREKRKQEFKKLLVLEKDIRATKNNQKRKQILEQDLRRAQCALTDLKWRDKDEIDALITEIEAQRDFKNKKIEKMVNERVEDIDVEDIFKVEKEKKEDENDQ